MTSFHCNFRLVVPCVLIGLALFAVINFTGSSLPFQQQELASPSYDWDVDVDNMTGFQILDYIRWPGDPGACKLVHQLAPLSSHISGNKSICLDKEYKPDKEKCLAYKFDIFNEWEVDESLAKYGCHVYSFDPVAKKIYNRTERIHVYPYGLSNRNRISIHNWTMFTLPEIYRKLRSQHGATVIDYLKLDTEDWDLRTLPQIITSGMLQR